MSGASIHLVWKDKQPVLSDAGFCIVPTDDFASDPDLDMICIPGGGVTAGIDLALTVIGELKGEAEAKAIQLVYEYAPEPPFGTGLPEMSNEPTIQIARSILAHMQDDAASR